MILKISLREKRVEVERPREMACFNFFSLNIVSIVEVEIFSVLPFSNWPDFRLGHVGPQMAQD